MDETQKVTGVIAHHQFASRNIVIITAAWPGTASSSEIVEQETAANGSRHAGDSFFSVPARDIVSTKENLEDKGR